MVLRKIQFSVIILILFINGCTQKDELTRPVRIHLKVGGTLPYGDWIWTDDPVYHIVFDKCQIGIQKLRFDGIREVGGEITFESDPENDLASFGFPGQYPLISDYDIPQGTYNTFKWDIFLKRIVDNELIEENNTALLNTGLFIKGNYYGLMADPDMAIPFIFAVSDSDLFSFRSLEDNIFNDNKEYSLNFNFDFANALGCWVSPNLFEEAEISGDGLNQKIVISRENNKSLYDGIMESLKTSLSLNIY